MSWAARLINSVSISSASFQGNGLAGAVSAITAGSSPTPGARYSLGLRGHNPSAINAEFERPFDLVNDTFIAQIRGAMSISPTRSKAEELERTIYDLNGLARQLDLQIKIEERRARISDPAQPGYPSFAVSARERLDRLRASIARFESELKTACRDSETRRGEGPPPVRPGPHKGSPKAR